MEQINALMRELPEKEEKLASAKNKLSELHHQLNVQYEELCDKDKVILSLQVEINSYRLEVNDSKTTAIVLENNNSQTESSKVNNVGLFVAARTKVSGLICWKFSSEKQLTSK